MENWKAIPGYEGLYEVSDLGNVRSLPRPRTKGGVLKQGKTTEGYKQVALCREGKSSQRLVHRLVLLAFKGPSDLETRHLNGVNTDNALLNLEYGTGVENAQDRAIHGTSKGEKNPASLLTEAKVKLIKSSIGVALKTLADQFGVSVGTIKDIRGGRTWRHVKL